MGALEVHERDGVGQLVARDEGRGYPLGARRDPGIAGRMTCGALVAIPAAIELVGLEAVMVEAGKQRERDQQVGDAHRRLPSRSPAQRFDLAIDPHLRPEGTSRLPASTRAVNHLPLTAGDHGPLPRLAPCTRFGK